MDRAGKHLLGNLGKAIRLRRQHIGFTQAKLAQLASLHRTYITDLEHGMRNASITTIAAIASALETTISQLTSGIEAGNGGPSN